VTPIDARRRRGRYRAPSGWESSHVVCCSADVLRRIFVSDDTRAAIKLRAVGWMESEVQLWLSSRIDHHHRAGVT
jgi:hypothetical protein